jgi:hypothetical protein
MDWNLVEGLAKDGLAKFDGVKMDRVNIMVEGLQILACLIKLWLVNAIAIDGQGNKWIGTYGGGLAKFDGVNWTVYKTSNSGLPDNYVWVQ